MRGVLLAALVTTLTGCGLENLPYLVPPGDSTPASSSTPIFTINNQATSESAFRGFEVYYKFYSSDQDTLMENQKGLTGITHDQIVTTYGFTRMCSQGTDSDQTLPYTPLIDVDVADRNTDFPTILYFYYNSETPYADYQGDTPRIIAIRRAAEDTTGEKKTFDDENFEEGDSDLDNVTWNTVTTDGLLYLVIYAFSYGVQDYSTALYSTARYLGYMNYENLFR